MPTATSRPSERTRRARYLRATAAVAALLIDIGFDPVRRHIPLCPFHAATGWWCPICGGLRSADALAHLQVRTALHDNLLFVLGLPLLAVWWLDGSRRERAGLCRRSPGVAGAAAVVALMVVFTVIRNLPIASALRPA